MMSIFFRCVNPSDQIIPSSFILKNNLYITNIFIFFTVKNIKLDSFKIRFYLKIIVHFLLSFYCSAATPFPSVGTSFRSINIFPSGVIRYLSYLYLFTRSPHKLPALSITKPRACNL